MSAAPPAAALAVALVAATGQPWRWMETHDGDDLYATLRLPCGATVTVTGPSSARTEDVIAQVCAAATPRA
jgi:hypothetical protein